MLMNKNFFFKESPELFYILGLWASDGCVYKNSMQIAMTDKDIIEWVAETIEYTGKIKEIKNYGGFDSKTDKLTSISHFIRINSKEVREVFESYGITAKKSLTIKFPKIPDEMIPHFIRGVFDGDGGIYVTKRKINGRYYDRTKVHFTSGSIPFLTSLKGHIEKQIGNNVQITKGTRCFIYAFEAKKDVKAFGEWIYADGHFGGERKRSKFAELGVTNALLTQKEAS